MQSENAFEERRKKEMTAEEKRLWEEFLSPYPVRFFRQKRIGKYSADFYCSGAGLVVLLEDEMERDIDRIAFLKRCGLTVLCISDHDINGNFREVCRFIHERVQQVIAERL